MNIITWNSVSPSLFACLYVLAFIILQFSVPTFFSHSSLLLVDLSIPWLYAVSLQLQAVCNLHVSIIMLSLCHSEIFSFILLSVYYLYVSFFAFLCTVFCFFSLLHTLICVEWFCYQIKPMHYRSSSHNWFMTIMLQLPHSNYCCFAFCQIERCVVKCTELHHLCWKNQKLGLNS